MTRDRYDYVIVGGGSAGSALANRSRPTPRTACWCSRRAAPTTSGTSSSTCRRRLPFPIGSRFYDWKYESEPEPHMNGRRIYHARGKVLGGSSSINGMIFQRGNPLDYERWGADPGMETWDYAHCLPYFKRMENCLAAGLEDEFRGHDGPLVLERGPATQPAVRRLLRGRPAGRLPAHRRRQRLPAGRLRAVRPQHPPRPAAVGGPRLPPPGDEPAQPDVETRALVHGPVRRRPRRRRRVPAPRQARTKRVTAGEVILCGGAINSPQLLQLSGVGNAGRAAARWASTSCTTCPASASTCRTTSRSTSSTPASSRSRSRRT